MTDRLKTVYPPKTSFCGGYNDSYRYTSLFDLAIFRADSRKSRYDLNKDNRVVATVVGSYICIMIQTCMLVHGY